MRDVLQLVLLSGEFFFSPVFPFSSSHLAYIVSVHRVMTIVYLVFYIMACINDGSGTTQVEFGNVKHQTSAPAPAPAAGYPAPQPGYPVQPGYPQQQGYPAGQPYGQQTYATQ